MTVFSTHEAQAIARAIAGENGLTVREDPEATRPSVQGTVITVPPASIYNHETYMQELHACINQASEANRFFNNVEPKNERQQVILDIIRDMHCDRHELEKYRGKDDQIAKRYNQRQLDIDNIQDKQIRDLLALGDQLRAEWQGTHQKSSVDVEHMQDFGKDWMSLRTEDDLRRLLKRIEEDDYGSESASGDGEGDEGEESSEGSDGQSGDDQEAQEKPDEMGQSDSGQDEEGEQHDGDQENQQDAKDSGDGQEGDSQESVDKDLKDQLQKAMPDYNKEDPGQSPGHPGYGKYKPVNDWHIVNYNKQGVDIHRKGESLRMLDKFSLSRRVKKLLLSMVQTRMQVGLKQGKLNASKITRLYTNTGNGQPRMYKKRDQGQVNLDVAFFVLTDHSGSMSGRKFNTAAACATAISEVLDSIKIPNMLATFSEHYKSNPGGVCSVMPVKQFSERYVPRDSLLDRFHYRDRALYNGNADGEAVMWAMHNLMRRPEKQKVLIVLSDGHPAYYSPYGGDSSKYLKDVVKEIEQSRGVDILGIGLQDRAVEKFYTRHKVLNNISQLETILIDLIKEKIL